MKKKEEYIQVCSKCGSPDIQTDYSNPAATAYAFFSKKCNHCGHVGKIFPEVPISKVRKPKELKQIKKREFFDKTFILGYTGIWKITGILGIIFGLGFLFVKPLRMWGIFFMLPLSILVCIYAFLRDKYKEKLFMKIIMIIIILTTVFVPLALFFIIKL